MSMQLPPFVSRLETFDPSLKALIEKEYELIFSENPALPAKESALILLAVDAFSGSTGVKPIADLCRKLGSTNEEIAHALRISHLVAGNRVLFAGGNAFSE